jgi:molybdopterin molybdotransferase
MIVLDENVTQLKKEKKVKILPINWAFFTHNLKDFLTYE